MDDRADRFVVALAALPAEAYPAIEMLLLAVREGVVTKNEWRELVDHHGLDGAVAELARRLVAARFE